MDVDEALGGVFDRERIEKAKALSMAHYEDRIVRKLMTQAGLQTQIPVMLKEVHDTTGVKPNLTFGLFHDHFPSFPVWLSIRRVPFVHEVSIKDLFNRFPSLKITEWWSEAVEAGPEGKPAALIFDFPGVKGSQLVCHNWDTDMELRETRICRRIGPGRGQLIWIERFEPFFDGIASVWAGMFKDNSSWDER
jgi:hypothetical protein